MDQNDNIRGFYVVIIGEGMDKLSFLCRIADNRNFSGLHYDDGGVIFTYNYAIREAVVNGERYRLEMWTGEDEVRLLVNTNPFVSSADGIIVVYDVKKRESFDRVQIWLTEMQQKGKVADSFLVGDEDDIQSTKMVSTEEGVRLASQMGIPFVESEEGFLDGLVRLLLILLLKKEETKKTRCYRLFASTRRLARDIWHRTIGFSMECFQRLFDFFELLWELRIPYPGIIA